MSKAPPASAAKPAQRRRRPRQQRAYITVANILEATERLAERDGFRRLETAKIAAAAGISIGSLYQYFPNLEAIALALFEERSAEVARSMKAAMVAIVDQPPEIALPGVMELILRLHEKNRIILRRMSDDLPQLNLPLHPASLDHLTRGSVAHYLRHRDARLKPADLNRKVFFLEKVVLGCIRSYLDDPRDISRKAFIRDLTALCVPYVQQP
jgi:AcrR family transcriptional regulator